MSVNSDLQDTSIRHRLALNSYDRSLNDQIVRLLDSADKDIFEKLAARLVLIEERGMDRGPATTARLKRLMDEIRSINSAVYDKLEQVVTDELVEFGQGEAAFHKAAIDTALPVKIATQLPSPARLKAIVTSRPMDGVLLSPWVQDMSAKRVARIEREIQLGLTAGEGTDKIVRRIRGTKAAGYEDGILQLSRHSAQTMVRTAITHVSNVTAQETWKANEHVVKGWMFVATLDSRTTAPCASNDGKDFPIGEGPIPPLHLRCRSITVAVTKSFRELGLDKDELTEGQRASMDGQVAGAIKYPEWLKGKDLKVQEQVLGKTRAKLFNEGRLPFDNLVDADGSLLTLAELKRAYPSILAK